MKAVVQRVSEARVRVRDGGGRRDRRRPLRAARRRARGHGPRRRSGWPERWRGCGSSRTTRAASTARCSTSAARRSSSSQFTLLADTAKGNRPSFTEAAPPEEAEPLYEAFCEALRELGVRVETGVFGARMAVELVNDGPVTIVLETSSRQINFIDSSDGEPLFDSAAGDAGRGEIA